MTVNELTDNFKRLETSIAAKKGDFTLFALFLREDVPDRWDLIVSAPWFGKDKQANLDYLISEIKSSSGPQDLTSLSRILLLDPEEAAVQNLNRTIQHGGAEIRDSHFFGLPIKHAFIITSKRPETAVRK